MKRKVLSLLLVLMMIISLCPTLASAANTYDAAKAVAWASDNNTHKQYSFNSTGIQCAEYVNLCLKQGGMPIPTYRTPGSQMQWVSNNGYGTIYAMNDTNLKKLEAGDFIVWACNKKHGYDICGLHTVFITAVDQSAKKLTYCANHNDVYNRTLTFADFKNMKIACTVGNDRSVNNGKGNTANNDVYIVHTNKQAQGSTPVISGASKPQTLKLGSTAFSVTGVISCGINITQVSARVYNKSTGANVFSPVKRSPNSKSYNLANIDSAVKFSAIKTAGDYIYEVKATTSKGTTTLINHSFSVIGGPTNVKISATPTKTTSSNNVKLSWSATNGEKYWLNIYKDGKHIFNNSVGTSKTKSQKYSAGYYTAWIEAINSVGTSQAVSCNFVVSDVTTSANVLNGTYRLISKASTGRCVTIADGTLTNKLNACIRNNYSSARQLFAIERQSDNTYLIKLDNTYALDVAGGAMNANLQLYTFGGENANRKFYLKDAGSGWYQIICQKSGQAVTVASNANNANLSLAPLSNSDNQKFKLAVPVTGISFNQQEIDIKEGETAKITPTVTPSIANDKSIQWSSSNTKVATVSSNGTVTAKSVGTANITATTIDQGKKASYKLNVLKAKETEGTLSSSITWKIVDDVLYIDGTGVIPDCSSASDAPWHESREDIRTIFISDGITIIGQNAFNGFSNLNFIHLTNTVTEVGNDALSGCTQLNDVFYTGLKSQWNRVNVNNNSDALGSATIHYVDVLKGKLSDTAEWQYYDGTLSITGTGVIPNYMTTRFGTSAGDATSFAPWREMEVGKVEVGEGITSIGFAAFEGMTSLRSVSLPSSLKTIKSNAFYQCGNLTSINIPGKVTSIESSAFAETGLTTVTIPDSVKGEASGWFAGCHDLKEVKLSNNLTSLRGTFYECVSLKKIKIPNSVKVFNGRTFYKCTSLSEVMFGTGLEKIFSDDFYGCSSLTEVALPEGLKLLGAVEDTGSSTGGQTFAECTSLETVVIPDSVCRIGEKVFENDNSLKNVNIPKGLSTISRGIFEGCSALNNLEIPRTVKDISNGAFYNSGISEIAYQGSEDDWGNVIIDSYNAPLLSANITYATPCTIVINENEEEPEESIVAKDGEEVKIVADVTGDEIEVQPQISEDGGLTWKNHILPEDDDEEEPITLNSNAKLRTMANSSGSEPDIHSFTITADINNPDLCYRFEVTDASNSTRYTHPVMVAVFKSGDYIISDDPDNQTVQVGDTVTFSVKAAGENLAYQWLQCDPGTEEWNNSDYPGSTTNTLNVTATEENAGTQFKCIVTDIDGTEIESDLCLLIKKEPVSIITQPDNPAGEIGEEVEMTIDASGVDVNYRWELTQDDGDTWLDCDYEGHDTNALKISVNENTLKEKYRCVVSDRYNNTVISDDGHVDDLSLFYQKGVTYDESIATLKSHTLSLTGDIGIIYNLYLSEEALNDRDAKVMFTYSGRDQGSVPVSAGVKKTDKNGKDYYGYCCEVHSSQMTGPTTAKVVLSDGRESEEFPYTVKEYADIIIANKNNSAAYTEVTPLVKAMLNYGGYAQEFFKYDTSLSLANADLTEAERDVSGVKTEDLAKYAIVREGTAPEGISYKSATLQLTSTTTIRYSFTLAEGHDISEYTFKNGNKVLKPKLLSDNVYCVYINDVASDELDNMYTVSVGDFSVTYGALTYAYNQLKKDTTPAELKDLLRAMVLYNKEANEYFA